MRNPIKFTQVKDQNHKKIKQKNLDMKRKIDPVASTKSVLHSKIRAGRIIKKNLLGAPVERAEMNLDGQ